MLFSEVKVLRLRGPIPLAVESISLSPHPPAPAEGLPGFGRSAQARLSRPVMVKGQVRKRGSGGRGSQTIHTPQTSGRGRGEGAELENARSHGRLKGVWIVTVPRWGRRASPDKARINVLTSPGQPLYSFFRRGQGRVWQLRILSWVRSLPAFLGSC